VTVNRVMCIVPAYQAADSVGDVVRGLRAAMPQATVHVIDDGSTDRTESVAAAAGARVTRAVANRGKGAALRVGFASALAEAYDGVITVDADGQHDPTYAPALVAALDDADVVVGVRGKVGTSMPLPRRLSNALSSAIVSACAGCQIPDAQSGYRAIDARVLRAVRPEGDRYEFESDFLILAGRSGFRIVGVPIPTIYGAPSHFRALADTGRVAGRLWHRLSTPIS
jgi:glycosyltransferase involved in cell wall biosynthesis